MAKQDKPLVLITGSAGDIGSVLREALQADYTVVGCDRPGNACEIEMDITSEVSVRKGLARLREQYGNQIAAVVHLAAFFDFSGEKSPLYDSVNVEGTKRLLEGLQDFEVGRFIYSGTMLVHAPCERGQLIDEESPVDPRWAYPQSKAEAEAVIHEHHGNIPYTILRLAGLYDDKTAIPTLSHQIARIYEQEIKSHLHAGDIQAGQAMIHRDDMVELFRRVIERRDALPEENVILAGEPAVMSYEELQDSIGSLIHGKEQWETLSLPQPLAQAGAWLEEKAEPVVPDALDRGEKPFIRPFMIERASDHYALDIRKAQDLLDWKPRHNLRETLPKLITHLKDDPAAWYEANGIALPEWMRSAEEKQQDAELLRVRYERDYQQQHRQNLWAFFANIVLGFWLISSPFTFGYQSAALIWSDIIAGALVVICASCSLSGGRWLRFSRFDTALIGLWLLFAPLIFYAPTAAAYLNDTLVGTLLIGFALLVRPFPAMSPAAQQTGPEVPPGWDFSPSSWFQRAPIIALAVVGFFISRYMATYQLGHIDAVWEPFFTGAIPEDAKNGTEEIITSYVSEAWPVPDAGLGALVYLLEILTGMIGSSRRWRTMPWLVLLFGFMIIPLGVVSITFIIIQPILLGTWCTLCLIAAAAMLLQIPYSFDEIVATIEFLRRRARAGRPWMRILFTGDTDEGSLKEDHEEDNFRQPPLKILCKMLAGGVSVPWNLAACCLIGLWLMFTRVTLGAQGGMADANHLIGALVVTITVTAFAEVARPLRFLNIFLGMALLITPFLFGVGTIQLLATLLCGGGLITFSFRRGAVENQWGSWSKYII